MELKEQLEDLFEKNATDFEISKAFREAIKTYKTQLRAIQHTNIGKDFLVKHTSTLDSFITLMYKAVLRKFFGMYMPMRNSIPIAFIALGSYGREQLAIYSDIDLFIAYEDVEGFNTKAIIESFIRIAWDAKLDLGYRVHEIRDITVVAREDITIRTALMESRFITGSQFVWDGATKELSRMRKEGQKAYILAKTQEAQTRRAKYPRSMQPNLKESMGGLRDANYLFWVAMTLFGDGDLRHYYGRFFSEQEYKEYRIALEFLFRVRTALHLSAGKKQDQLILDFIPDVRKMLGLPNDRTLSYKLLEAMHTINLFSTITAQRMISTFYPSMLDFTARKSARIAKGIYLIEGKLFATHHLAPMKLTALLELLGQLPDVALVADPSMLAHLRATIIPSHLSRRNELAIYKLFRKAHTHALLSILFEADILDALIPQLSKVKHLAQYDGYHHYPVLIHSLKSVEALESIEDTKIAALYDALSVEEKAFLKLVVLLHDAGKGRTQDHHEVGAKIFAHVATHYELPPHLLKWGMHLIRYHTLMSNVAFREDIYHEKTLFTFMSIVEEPKLLDLLFILTYADISGVGPDMFTVFNSRLLHKLYANALEISDQKEHLDEAAKRLKKEKALQKLPAFLELPKIRQKHILDITSNLFFIKYSTHEILELAQKASDIESYRFFVHNEGHLRIEIFRKIPLNIGFLLAKLSRLSIVSMDIFKLYNEMKYFCIDFDTTLSEDDLAQIDDIIAQAFDMSKRSSIPNVEILPKEITLDCHHSNSYALMEIHARDQKGLLAFIMSIFERESIDIATAKIHTLKHRVRDIFLIEKTANLCQNETKIIQLLTQKAS
ncbi:MAG: hypothetical protein KU37_11435 [Sulfuricurvum sp. PC08-66]|nr:MAG: hypothetical protein KU37_11435 [Sulfuricurvum sp. PC08-66]